MTFQLLAYSQAVTTAGISTCVHSSVLFFDPPRIKLGIFQLLCKCKKTTALEPLYLYS